MRHYRRGEPPCAECREARRRYSADYRAALRGEAARPDGLAGPAAHLWGDRDGCVPALCWCEEEIMRVPLDLVRRCETVTCGRVACRPPAVAA